MKTKKCQIHGINKVILSNGKLQCKKCNVKKVVDYRVKKKLYLVNYFGGKCARCPYNKCLSALTFHHLDPQKKEFTISSKNKSIETLLKEAKKCILLCRNCHAEEHASPDSFNFKGKRVEIRKSVIITKKCIICNKHCSSNSSVFCSKLCQKKNYSINRMLKSGKIKEKQKTYFRIHELSKKDINITKKLMDKHKNYEMVGKLLGCSGNAIKKRLKNYHPNLVKQIKLKKEKISKRCKCCHEYFKANMKNQIYCNQICHLKARNNDYNKNIDVIIKLLKQGYNKSEISKKINIHRRTITGYIQKYNQ